MKIHNISIVNNDIEGQESGGVRLRLFHVDAGNGGRHPSNVVFDIAPGEEHRVNLTSALSGIEIRPHVDGSSWSEKDEVEADVFGKIDAYEKLKAAIRRVPVIRNDMTLSQAERDEKAGGAWAEVLRLASQ